MTKNTKGVIIIFLFFLFLIMLPLSYAIISGDPCDKEGKLGCRDGINDELLICKNVNGNLVWQFEKYCFDRNLDAWTWCIEGKKLGAQCTNVPLNQSKPLCIPGDEKCETSEIYVCNNEKKGWEDLISCAYGCASNDYECASGGGGGGGTCTDNPDSCDSCLERENGEKCDAGLNSDGTGWACDDECKSNACAGGIKQCWQPNCASNNKCTAWWWAECYNPGELCCQGDNNPPYSTQYGKTFGQYYCKSDKNWARCDNQQHNTCDVYNPGGDSKNYYCTVENGVWKWRKCTWCMLPVGICVGNCDNDHDGYKAMAINCGGNDCDDNDAKTYPGALDLCDGKDNDCDGIADSGISECDEGEKKCSGNYLQKCKKNDKDECRKWKNIDYCDKGCENNICKCTNACNPGETRCGGADGKWIMPCVLSEGGCYVWGTPVDYCNNGCENGKCKDCIDACKIGETRCGSNEGRWIIPCEKGEGGCNRWGIPTYYCKSSCENGICKNETGCYDNDKDGYKAKECGGNDCNDNNAEINPNARELCNGIDNDCDGIADEGTNECQEREKRCGGNYLQTCGNIDKDTCREWQNQYCSYGCDSSKLQCQDSDNCNWPGQYLCYEGNSYFCDNNNKKILKEVCRDLKFCNFLTGKCSEGGNVELSIEEAIPPTKVFKQLGDYVTLKIKSDRSQKIFLDYPNIFEPVDEECKGSISVSSGITECKFKVDEFAGQGTYSFESANSKVELEIIYEPSLLIITNKEKLKERFNDEAGVLSLLKQAYAKASNKYGIVYNLEDYIQGHPFASFESYDENPTKPTNFEDYGRKVSELVNNKCKKCKDTIILGDDYVVPFYRVDYTNLWFFGLYGNYSSWLLSDTPYIPKNIIKIKDIDTIFDKRKKVAIVKPDSFNSIELDNLINFLKSEFQLIIEDYDNYDSSSIGCNSFWQLSGKSLILIGNRKNNNAIKCVPWFEKEKLSTDKFDASISIERNVWGGGDFAVILSGNKPVIAINTLKNILENDTYYEDSELGEINTAYLYEVSEPLPQITYGQRINGFVLGMCEELEENTEEMVSCMASDFTFSALPGIGVVTDIRDAVLFCPAFASNESGIEKIICGASAGGALASVGSALSIGVAFPADATTSAAKVTAKAFRRAFGASSTKLLRVIGVIKEGSWNIFLEPLARLFKKGNVAELTSAVIKPDLDEIISTASKKAQKVFKAFSEKTLTNTIKNADDIKFINKGVKKIDKTNLNKLLQLSGVSEEVKLNILRDIGEAQDLMNVNKKFYIKIEFQALPPKEWGSYKLISKKITIDINTLDEVVDYKIILHETSHAKADEIMNYLKAICGGQSPSCSCSSCDFEKLRGFMEFSADKFALHKKGTEYADSLVRYFNNEINTIKLDEPLILAQYLALSKIIDKTENTENLILRNINYLGSNKIDKIKKLAGLYTEKGGLISPSYFDIVSSSSNPNRVKQFKDLLDYTKEIRDLVDQL